MLWKEIEAAPDFFIDEPFLFWRLPPPPYSPYSCLDNGKKLSDVSHMELTIGMAWNGNEQVYNRQTYA